MFFFCISFKQNPESSRIVRVASCTSISDLLTRSVRNVFSCLIVRLETCSYLHWKGYVCNGIRLSRFSNTKKDAVSHAAKVILPVIKLLEEDSSEALWVSAMFKKAI